MTRGFISSALAFVYLWVVSANGEEWARAIGPRQWQFPRDHGAHPEFRTEWWYFTGCIADGSGNRYGYQLTFFRHALRKELPPQAGLMSVRDIYTAHLAITDVSSGRFLWTERASRTGPGLAGSDTDGMDVWVLNWRARMDGNRITLRAESDEGSLKLTLKTTKPVVLHGERGLSRKGATGGWASYYYSLTALETMGFIRARRDSQQVEVRGRSWFDHEFGSNQLGPDQRGWDWFGLHLSDGRELMIYHLRRDDGALDPASSGTLVEPDGASHHLRLGEFSIDVLRHWRSPKSGALYPSGWWIRVPSREIEVHIAPLLQDQELLTEFTAGAIYWEGAVSGNGRSKRERISCEGYAELTGYAGSMGGAF